ncbi:ferrochelatase [Campylobacter majalis]|uniref:ferrochelatase n=1 Tax=Campylobacter majalis TaxID=2790656 RepID=UPI003D69D7DB
MRVENLASLIKGVFENHVSITHIGGYSFEAKNVKRTHAYICLMADESEIELAIKNGAYAIITSEKIIINDSEVAYIRVENINTALIRLMRYFASQKALKFYCVNAVQMQILSKIHAKNINFISKDLATLFKSIENAAFGAMFFGADIRILQQLNPLYEHVFADVKIYSLNSGSIFFTNVIIDDVYYQGLGVAGVFLPSFAGLVKFLNSNKIEYKIGEIKNLGHFEPIFIDKNFAPVSFGSSFRAVICESDEELFKIEANYLYNKFGDGVKILVPKMSWFECENAIKIDDLRDVKEYKNFRYVLIFCKKQELLEILSEEKQTLSLF